MATNNGVYLTIENAESLTAFIKGAVKNGYLRRLDLRDVIAWMNQVSYPIQIQVDINSVVNVGRNAVVKGVFGKAIDETITKYIRTAMEAG